MSSNQPLLLERDGAIAYLTFNRPERMNALDIPTALAFQAACRSLAGNRTVRAVVLRGAGRSFGVGGDLDTLSEGPVRNAPALIGPLHDGMATLASLDAPVIAALHGHVAGAGVSIALGADLAVAAASTRLSVAYGQLGASCDLGLSWALPRLVGMRRALEIALLGDVIMAEQALQLGLVNRVVPDDTLDAAVSQLARRLAEGPTFALGQWKRLLRQSGERDLPAQLEAEQAAFLACAGTKDFCNAVAAFKVKRSPRFDGY